MLKNYTIILIKICCFLPLSSCQDDFKLNEHEDISLKSSNQFIAENVEDNVELTKEQPLVSDESDASSNNTQDNDKEIEKSKNLNYSLKNIARNNTPVRILKTSNKSNIDQKLFSELTAILQLINSDEINSAEIKIAYEEVKAASKNCYDLKEGTWYKKSKNFTKGLKCAELLGVASLEFENYSSEKAKVETIINSIRNFEDLCSEMFKSLKNETITKDEANDIIKGLAQYFESLYLLKNFLQIAKINKNNIEYTKYVIESSNSIEKSQVIPYNTAKILLKKIDNTIHFMESISEEYNLVDDKDKVIIATPSNMLKHFSLIEHGKKLIGGTISPTGFDLNEDIYKYKAQLTPGSVFWTFMDVADLRDGSWDNSFLPKIFKDKDKSVVKIFHDLNNILNIYEKYILQIKEQHQKYTDTDFSNDNLLLNNYRNIIKDFKNDKYTIEAHEKGKQAIVEMRKILSKKGKFNIGRFSPTEGLSYVGKWKRENRNQQIRVDQYEGMNALLDYLSCVAIQIDSEMTVSSLINYTKVLNNGKEPWIFESENEQRNRIAGVANQRTFLALIISFIFNGAVDVLSHVSLPFAAVMLGTQAAIYAYNLIETS